MKTESIKKNIDFKKVYKRGRSNVGRYLVVYLMKNRTSENRLGITVSKKVGNAVIRNRVRRLIKETFRKYEDTLSPGYDIVIVARVASNSANYKQIDKNLIKLISGIRKD
jgi:ribonuclease P protein component